MFTARNASLTSPPPSQVEQTDKQDDLVQELATLVDILRWRAVHQPNQSAYTFLVEGERDAVSLTYQELDRQARVIGAMLQSLGAAQKRALLLYQPGLEYIAAFFGCLYAGVAAVPSYPPRINRSDSRLQAIIVDSRATLVLTTTDILSNIDRRFTLTPGLKALHWLSTDNLSGDWAEKWESPGVDGEALAFLQYTSGSTANPKGVMVSHGNLLHNSSLIQRCFELTRQSVNVIWLPPYHDMGLIGGILQPLYCGYPAVLMSPFAFLQQPSRWLQAISLYRGTASGGPNFAFDLCVEKIPPDQRVALDLSSWTVAFNGAEPIRPETMERFTRAFEPCGFRWEAFAPCYGLAEATLIVSGSGPAVQPTVRTFRTTALQQNRVLETVAKEDNQALAGCGRILPGQEVVIAYPELLTRCAPNEIGEVWISSPSVAQGYWGRPEETKDTFQAFLADTGQGPFLRTGDLGFLWNGELFVVGRIKDLIIVRGRNYYPQDIELTVEHSHPALQPGGGAAFSIDADSSGAERLVVVQEVSRTRREVDIEEVAQAIRQAVFEEHELQVYAVVLIEPKSIPKTSSGKIQRRLCRTLFLKGDLQIIGSSILDTLPHAALDPIPVDNLIHEELARAGDGATRQSVLMHYLQKQVARVLRVPLMKVDTGQPLATLGLDSLTAIELQHCLQTDLGVGLAMADALRGPSIAELATWVLDRLVGEASWSTPLSALSLMGAGLAGHTKVTQAVSLMDQAPPIQPFVRDAFLPLSFAQQRLWLLDQLEPGNPLYNIPVVVRLTGPLDVAALGQSLNEIVKRHESLRTSFTAVDGQPVQVIAPGLTLALPVVDLGEWTETTREAAAQRLTAQEIRRSFDLTQAPLLRTVLLRLAEQEHVFLLVSHHIVSDGWSLGVLGREISALYKAFSSRQSSPLPPLPIQYADFAHWQRQWFRDEVLAPQIAYWQEKLGGSPPWLELPADRSRPPIRTFQGARQCVCLSSALTQALQDLSRREGVTLFMMLLAAFKVLLCRYTGQEDIVVGTPIAGRNRAEVEGLVGIFLNSLVLRSDLSGNPTFRELLARVRQVTLEAYTHQDLPFEKLLEVLRPKRDLSHTPLFQVFINLLDFPNNKLELPGIITEILSAPEVGSNFDLTLYITPQDEGLRLEMVYNPDLFEQERMAETLAQLECLLWQITANPQERIAHFSLITPISKACLPNPIQVLRSGWEGAIPAQFSQRARRTPEHPAVVDSCGTWRYQELEARSNQLARHLLANNIQSQALVVIYGHRSAALAWALLGVLKAGASFLILDPAYPAARLMDYICVAQPRGWIQLEAAGEPAEALKEFAATLSCHVVLPRSAIDAPSSLLTDYSTDDPGIAPDPDDLTYVEFTSGSTGKPKGVVGTHRPLSHFLQWHCKTFGLDESDRFSMFSGLAHDPLLRDIFTPLWVGATLCVPEPDAMLSPDRLIDWMKQEEISIAHMTPTIGQLLTGTMPGMTTVAGQDILLPSLRYVFFGGDVLTRWDVSNLRALAPSATCVNFYGATETPQAMGYFVVPNHRDAARDSALSESQPKARVPVGQGIEGVQLLVLNASQQLAGVGEVGEIHIRTPYLTQGYLGDDVLTQEKFIINPFTKASEDRLYETGDWGRYLPGGNVEFLGRTDHQVKIRGFRIELEEIEAVLGQHPTVHKAVVVARSVEHVSGNVIPGGDKQLVAYVLPALDQTPVMSALRRFLQEKLPEHMLPSAFIVLDALPLTPNGKVDRRALPKPERLGPEMEAAYVAPRTRLEQALAAIWQEALQVEQVGIHDNFFDSGGHSLLLAWVRSKLQAVLERDISMIELFKYPTISTLAEYLSQQSGKQPSLQPSHDRAQARIEAMSQQRQFRQQHRAQDRAE